MEYTREQANTELWSFIYQWCEGRGLSPLLSCNYEKGAMAWAESNAPPHLRKPKETP